MPYSVNFCLCNKHQMDLGIFNKFSLILIEKLFLCLKIAILWVTFSKIVFGIFPGKKWCAMVGAFSIGKLGMTTSRINNLLAELAANTDTKRLNELSSISSIKQHLDNG